MTGPLVDRLLEECVHLRPLDDPELDALRRALLVEDVLGVRLTDEQIAHHVLTDPAALRRLSATRHPRV
ncbi:hypothetical protein FOJ82_05835 [Tessaracoccus rhinocerotis]|uniref:Uncharacterized protein n=1 Tax=Tessaracoccus rhinocerotis TaxID=1689449 RepID=A0A553K1R4_9ACTN|nr:hypothetical protein [Tessaracoccus rhinocerotis]TRY18642.1 hypothetical protein FOJ82_05835 [Tessaracoccus rhinocerotis]